MHEHPPTPVEALRRACEIGRKAGLRYVYEGNIPGEGGENTHCHQCGALLIERHGFFVRHNRIRAGACPKYGTTIDGIGLLWPWFSKLPLGRLPGDIVVEREGFRFYTRRIWILRKARRIYRAREQGTTTSNSGLYCEES